jgi:hypothetical protein
VGKLVQFESREKGGSPAPREGAAAEAQILIFTGVRYERQADSAPTKPTATSSGGKRKRG